MSRYIATSAIRGANNIVRETELYLEKALKEKGADAKVGFPNTAYFLPTILGLTGRKVETVGDLVPVIDHVKSLLHPVPPQSRWTPYLGETLDSGIATLLSVEALEALRYLPYYHKETKVIVNTQKILPAPVTTGIDTYPADVLEQLKSRGLSVFPIDAFEIARSAGETRAVNMVLVGPLSVFLGLDEKIFLDVIDERVPEKVRKVNREAFLKNLQHLVRAAHQRGIGVMPTLMYPQGLAANKERWPEMKPWAADMVCAATRVAPSMAPWFSGKKTLKPKVRRSSAGPTLVHHATAPVSALSSRSSWAK